MGLGLFLAFIAWFAGLNVFGALMPDLLGRVLTCLIVGSGSELLYTIVNWVGEQANRASYSYRQVPQTASPR